jgi:hypothetical protein
MRKERKALFSANRERYVLADATAEVFCAQ